MKHTLFILGALFAGTFLFAEELDVNGNFMKTSPQDAKQPAGWTKSWSNMKDIGNVTLEKGSADGRNAVRIRTTKLLTPYTSLVEIPVTAGKEITISFDAKGKGRISDCFYVHGVAPKKDMTGVSTTKMWLSRRNSNATRSLSRLPRRNIWTARPKKEFPVSCVPESALLPIPIS